MKYTSSDPKHFKQNIYFLSLHSQNNLANIKFHYQNQQNLAGVLTVHVLTNFLDEKLKFPNNGISSRPDKLNHQFTT